MQPKVHRSYGAHPIVVVVIVHGATVIVVGVVIVHAVRVHILQAEIAVRTVVRIDVTRRQPSQPRPKILLSTCEMFLTQVSVSEYAC